MAKKSLIEKAKKHPKFSTRAYNRCGRCGRPRAVFRDYCLCRMCFRYFATQGWLPGIKKSSW